MGRIDRDTELSTLRKELDELNAAAEKCLKLSAAGKDQEARFDLYVKTNRLLQAVRGPVDMMFAHLENMAYHGSIRTLLEAGVFHAIPAGGQPVTAKEISAKLGMDKDLIVRLMRAVTPFGPFRETDEEEYAHTRFSEAYLAPQQAAMFSMMTDEFFLPMLRNHEFLRQENWKNTITLRHNPYTFTHNCEGRTMSEHVSSIPERFTRFNEAMMAQDDGGLAVDMYPFEAELTKDAEDGRATIIDVGGGRGHILRQIKGFAPSLKGRFILQDQAAVIAENGKALEADGFEAMAHDFFTPQPIKGALVYYIRRCFHDWPDEPEARNILENLVPAMDREKSRVLITEFVVPEVGAGMLPAWMDQTMLTFGGVERTEKDWARLLDSARLKLVKVWKAPGTPTGVVEARLK